MNQPRLSASELAAVVTDETGTMTDCLYVTGDVFDVLAQLPDNSTDLVLTSPPFLALRSYLPADHPDKTKEIGSEPTPAAFLDTLLALTAEWGRVLAPHGSICVELGDTYSGSGGAGGDYGTGGLRDGQAKSRRSRDRPRDSRPGRDGTATAHTPRPEQGGGNGWPLAKSMVGIPHLYHLSLAYGRNILTGQPSPAGQWRIRNVVAWCRPNPPVGALGDKFRCATSYLTVACRATDRYFDLDAVRNTDLRDPSVQAASPKGLAAERLGHHGKGMPTTGTWHANGGAPPLDHWNIPTHPYAGAHYACFPPALCETPIKAMVPLRVCRTCGQPSRRIVSDATYVQTRNGRNPAVLDRREGATIAPGVNSPATLGMGDNGVTRQTETLGWTDCGHGDNWRNGRVLDPFGGSGTVGQVATGHGRDALLVDLDSRNVELAEQRVGPLMFRHVTATEAAVWLDDQPADVGEVG